MLHSVKTGLPAFDDVFGMPIFAYFNQQPEPAAIFDACMTSFSSTYKDAVISSYDFSPINTLIDVGGGQGSLIAGILQKYPTLKGAVYEQEHVIQVTKKYLKELGLNERCQAIDGDFFECVPMGGDAYIMQHIIHDWDDERSVQILKNCYDVMPINGKLLVVENVISNINEPYAGKFLDLDMLVMTSGGQERTPQEFEKLLNAAGFQLTRIIPTGHSVSIIEGVKNKLTHS